MERGKRREESGERRVESGKKKETCWGEVRSPGTSDTFSQLLRYVLSELQIRSLESSATDTQSVFKLLSTKLSPYRAQRNSTLYSTSVLE